LHYKCPECGHEEYICPYCHKPVHKDDEKCPHCKKRMIRDLKIWYEIYWFFIL
jgi:DNA-directed RNA polymerase subunit RPC12/RpoP